MSKVFGDIAGDPAKVAPDLSKIMNIDAAIIEKSIADAAIPAKDIYSYKTVPEALDTVSKLMNLSGQVSEPIDWKAIFDQQYLPEDAKAQM